MSLCTRVCIVGAGINGLATAVTLQASGVNAEVTIIADKFSPETTSDVAAGLIEPYDVGVTPPELVRRWTETTIKHLRKLFMDEICCDVGVTQLSGYVLYKTSGNDLNPHWRHIVGNFCVMSPTELEQFPGVKEGMFFSTYQCETTKYMSWLLSRFKKQGGQIIQRRLSRLEDIAEDYDIIVNCTGIGARQLVHDRSLDALRGQLILLKAPWVQCFYIWFGTDSYVIPGPEGLYLGSTKQRSNWDTKVSEKDSREILQKGYDHMPSLKGSEVISERVGFRPVRDSVCLERGQDIIIHSRKVPVIHNYGQGGCGITLHMGCAVDTVQLITEAAAKLPTKSRL